MACTLEKVTHYQISKPLGMRVCLEQGAVKGPHSVHDVECNPLTRANHKKRPLIPCEYSHVFNVLDRLFIDQNKMIVVAHAPSQNPKFDDSHKGEKISDPMIGVSAPRLYTVQFVIHQSTTSTVSNLIYYNAKLSVLFWSMTTSDLSAI